MITITVEDMEIYDNATEQFDTIRGGSFKFEHSLIAISKWESIWKVPFFSTKLTSEQLLSYFECMCINGPLKPEHVTQSVIDGLTKYMNDPYTATTIVQRDQKPNRDILTSEVLYGYMVSGNVPFECAKWNIRRLMVLLNVVAEQNAPAKKMTNADVYRQNKALNDARRKKFNTKG